MSIQLELFAVVSPVLKTYFNTLIRVMDLLVGAQGGEYKLSRLLSEIADPPASIDQRIAKIDTARDNLLEGLSAIDQLRKEAEENKKELAKTIQRLQDTKREHANTQHELHELKKMTNADAAILQNLIGRSPHQILRDRIFGFFSGVLASAIASLIIFAIPYFVKMIG